MRKKLSKKKKTTAIIFAVLVVAALIYTAVSESGIANVPTWDNLYSASGFSNGAEVKTHDFSVSYIDVGQGDCQLIKCGGQTLLIDAGEKENAAKVSEYLKSAGVTSLDYVIATHPHSDHIGGLPEIIRSFEVKNIIMPKLPASLAPKTKIYKDLLLAVKESGAAVIEAKPGQSFTLGEAKIEILGPAGTFKDLNSFSVITRVIYGENKFLFTGDAEKEAELAVLETGADVECNVLKAGHHGSRTSTDKSFLTAASPDIVIIQAGEGNDYGHPHEETMKLLKERGLKTYVGFETGNILISSDGKKLSVFTEKQVDSI